MIREPFTRPLSRTLLTGALAAACVGWTGASASAQLPGGGRYYPHDHTVPPGMAGQWAAILHPGVSDYFQPIRVELPVPGQVTFFTTKQMPTAAQTAPAGAAILVGRVYRVKIDDMPDYPGVELYPTIELLDRLHPPPGRAAQFPVPIVFSMEEFDEVLRGRMLTKVVYLEQPDRAAPFAAPTRELTRLLGAGDNAVAVADQLGRPIAIVRLGGRLPDAINPDAAFFGSGAPVLLPAQPANNRLPPQSRE